MSYSSKKAGGRQIEFYLFGNEVGFHDSELP